jgi:hypothetical protein
MSRIVVWRALVVGSLAVVVSACKFGASSSTSADGGVSPQPAVLTISPSSVDCGTVDVGSQSKPSTVTVSNTGGGSAAVAVALSGADASQFALDSDACSGATLAPGESCSVTVHFSPQATGPHSATLTASAIGVTPVSASLTGTGAGPISFSPATQDYGTVGVGATSSPQSFTLTNNGATSTNTITLSIGGNGVGQYKLVADTCTGKKVPAGATCTVGVTFTPAVATSVTGKLFAAIAGVPFTASASLSGTGAKPPAFALGPSSYDFGSIGQGSTTAAQTFTVANTGGLPSPAPTVAITGSQAGEFTVVANGCTAPLPPAATCTFALAFAPTTALAESATVNVSGTSIATVSAYVKGTGLPPAALTITPPAHDFGPSVEGTPTADVPFLVTNTGGIATGALAVTLGGTNGGQFALGTDGCTGQTLAAAGGTCTVNVHFAPGAGSPPGSVQATLQVTGTPGGTGAATLTGTAVLTPQLVVAPAKVDFGQIGQQSSSGDVSIMVTNAGGLPTGTLSAAVSGTDAAQFGIGPDTCSGLALAAGASCTIGVHFWPAAGVLGSKQGTFTVTATPGGSPTVSLAGTAVPPAGLTITGGGNFGQVVQGSTSPDAVFTVANKGGTITGYLAVALGGANPNQFVITSDACSGLSLGPGASCSVKAHFAPTAGASGAQQATLTASASPGGATSIALTGDAVTPAALALLPPNGFKGFPPIAIGGSTSATFTVVNTGGQNSGPLSITSNNKDFTITNNTCPGTLGGGAQCTFGVTFKPSASGFEQSTLMASAAPGGSPTYIVGGSGYVLTVTIQVVDVCGGGYLTGSINYTPPSGTCITPPGGGTCTFTPPYGSTVQLTLGTFGPGSFSSWGGACSGTGTSCTVTNVTTNVTINANVCSQIG